MLKFYERKYNKMVREMKGIIAGIRKHKNDPGFPPELNEEELQAMLDKLAKSRADLIESLAARRQSRAALLKKEKELDEMLDQYWSSFFMPDNGEAEKNKDQDDGEQRRKSE